jgi:alkylhydroperoxidase family enzyme
MAALSWAESVTLISTGPDIDGKLQALLEHYSDTEAVDLTVIISLMNCMNRLSIGFGEKPTKRNT